VKFPFSVAVAIGIGVIVLAGYFLKSPLILSVRMVLLEWATILAAVAVLVGIANLFTVHWGKMTSGKVSGIYSGILIVSLILTLGIVGWFGPTHIYSMWIFNYIHLPVEGSLMALLAIILVLAGIRLLRRRSNMLSIVFIVTAIVILLATGPLFGISVPGLAELRTWIAQVPAMAGARGLLLGIALGIVATGLRILIGSDRPYGGK
jgi:hypothetical protein